jgi:autotransporter-associated beta strand protein
MGEGRTTSDMILPHFGFQKKTFGPILIVCFVVLNLGAVMSAEAASSAWNLDPASGDWNTATNWTPEGVPNGSGDTATFDVSNITGVSVSANTEVDGIVFNAGVSAFTVTASPTLTLTISGVGITNNSGIAQNFVAAVDGDFHLGVIVFENGATAGSDTFFTNNGGAVSGSIGGNTEFFIAATAGNGNFTNNGGAVSFAGGGSTQFFNLSTAGSGTFTNNAGMVGGAGSGFTQFFNAASADSGTFTNNGGAVSGQAGGTAYFFGRSSAGNGFFTSNGGTGSGALGGSTQFLTTSSAENGTFITNGGTISGAFGGLMQFNDSSTAGNGTFTTNGGAVSGAFGGEMDFFNTSSAGTAALTANGGLGGGGAILFRDDATGDTSSVEVHGNGFLDISNHNAPGVTVGSIKGDGNVFVGSRNLTVGSNNVSTTFSGVIQDGGAGGGSGGSLTKSGAGTLTLSGTNTYTGATTVSGGAVSLSGSLATGAVDVSANGQLINNGTIGGDVTVNGQLSGCGTINGSLTVNLGGVVDLVGCAVTINGPITNDGLFILSDGAQLAGVTSFTNNGTLDIITAGTFTPPPGFVNNGTIIDSSVAKVETLSMTGTTITITINSYTDHTYQMQASSSPDSSSFTNLGSPQQGATGTVLTFTDPNATGSPGFYRILINP